MTGRSLTVSQIIGKRVVACKTAPSGYPGRVYEKLMANVGAPTDLDDLFDAMPARTRTRVIRYLREMWGIDIVTVPRRDRKWGDTALYMIPHERV